MSRLICPACAKGLLKWKDGIVPASKNTGSAIMVCQTCGAETTMDKMLSGLSPKPPEHWLPIDEAPWNTEVLLTGPSGCSTKSGRFIINGYRCHDWHGGKWNDLTGTLLEDSGWEPYGWLPLEKLMPKE